MVGYLFLGTIFGLAQSSVLRDCREWFRYFSGSMTNKIRLWISPDIAIRQRLTERVDTLTRDSGRSQIDESHRFRLLQLRHAGVGDRIPGRKSFAACFEPRRQTLSLRSSQTLRSWNRSTASRCIRTMIGKPQQDVNTPGHAERFRGFEEAEGSIERR